MSWSLRISLGDWSGAATGALTAPELRKVLPEVSKGERSHVLLEFPGARQRPGVIAHGRTKRSPNITGDGLSTESELLDHVKAVIELPGRPKPVGSPCPSQLKCWPAQLPRS